MCGFVVLLRLAPETGDEAPLIERMTEVIRHRGPDDTGVYYGAPVAMGFRRLSILDTSPLGHQPMLSEDGQVALVFNGEIYNYIELRGELEGLGHRFRSTGDTEVLLRAYLQWGTGCVARLNGMWAFAIHDRREEKLVVSRDRFGMKPLYRWSDGQHVLFASEIKSIRASGLYRDAVNWRTAARYLVDDRLDDTLHTFYSGIEQVPPATVLEMAQDGRCNQWLYWSLGEPPPSAMDNPAAEFADLFEDAVRLHMRSDVPLAVHLSGGLDSSSIICASARLRRAAGASGPLSAFSYIAPEYDESRYITDTVEHAGATLVSLAADPHRLWELIGEVLRFQDEPVNSMAPIVAYELMRLTAASGIKVVLNGQGADETLAGYPSYFGDYWRSLLAAGRVTAAWREISAHAAVHGENPRQCFVQQARRAVQSRLGATSGYRALVRWRRRRRPPEHRWYTRELTCHLPEDDIVPAPASLKESLAWSIQRTPLPRYLRIEDRNSMAHSIESRLPFLDHRLVSFAFALPDEWRLSGPWNKYVQRQAMRGRIPESVRTRVDKMGFPVPARNWLAGTLHECVLDLLSSRKVRERGIYNVDSIITDVERHRRGEVDMTDGIFDVAQLEAWLTL